MKSYKAKLGILLICLVVNTALPVNAQESGTHRVILRNGDTLSGVIVKQSPGKYYQLKMQDGRILTVYLADIEDVQRILTLSDTTDFPKLDVLPRFWTSIEPCLTIGLGNPGPAFDIMMNQTLYLGVHLVNSFRINPLLYSGIGIGLETYSKGYYVPVYADFRIIAGKKKVVPLAKASIGYTFGWIRNSTQEWGGVLFAPSLGVVIRRHSRLGIFLLAESRFQQIRITHPFKNNDQKVGLKMIGLKLGIVF